MVGYSAGCLIAIRLNMCNGFCLPHRRNRILSSIAMIRKANAPQEISPIGQQLLSVKPGSSDDRHWFPAHIPRKEHRLQLH